MVSVLRVLSVMLALISMSACETSNINPNSPTAGFDPSKPVDSSNMPPGPGSSVRASVQSWGIYLGDCPDNPASCQRQIHPTDVPELQMSPPPWPHDAHATFLSGGYVTRYTMHLCVNHPKVAGRRLSVKLVGPNGEFSGAIVQVANDEGAIDSPFCVGVPYQMSYGEVKIGQGNGGFEFREDNQDLLTPTTWKVSIGVRAVDSRIAGH